MKTLLLLIIAATSYGAIVDVPHPQQDDQLILHQRTDRASLDSDFSVLDWDQHHAFPHRMLGHHDLPGGSIQDASDLHERLMTYLADHPNFLTGGKATPDDLVPLHLEQHGKLWYATYQQVFQGHLVVQTKVTFRVSEAGRILMAGSDLHPDLSLAFPVLNRDAAMTHLMNLAEPELVQEVEIDEEWMILPILHEKNFRFEAVWSCRINLEHPEKDYRVFLSALDGQPLWVFNQVLHLTGSVEGLVELEQPSDPELPLPLSWLNLSLDGQSIQTERDGSFEADVEGDGPWLLEGQLLGSFANVNRMDGTDASFDFLLSSDGEVQVVDLDMAQVQELDAYYHTTAVHDFIKDMDESFTGLDEPLPVNININSTCNAYWDGNSINFFLEGGGCPNTARTAGVVYHEYGHGINHRQYVQGGAPMGMTNGGMHEGLADVTAVYLMDLDYVSPGWFIRDLDNTNRYPENVSGQVHNDGLIIGGAMWDMREAIGLEWSSHLYHYARWGTPNDPDMGRVSFEYFIEILLVDDDDGDMSNLTPNFDAINTAFNLHGVGSDLAWMTTDFALLNTPFMTAPMEDVYLQAELTETSFLTPTGITVHAWDGTNDTLHLPMSFVDGTWELQLPGQPWNTVLSYYASLENDADVEILAPTGAPDQVYRTRFAFASGLEFDFEEEAVGSPQQGIWEWGTATQGPNEASSGVALWGTNLHGDYPDFSIARLVFPSQEVADDRQVIIHFEHWMDIEEGWDGAHVEMSVDGEDWQLITPLSGYDFTTPDNNVLPYVPAFTGMTEGWEELVFDLTGSVENGQSLALRFSLFSDGSVTAPGWFVDDLRFLGFAAPGLLDHTPLADTEAMDQDEFLVQALFNGASTVESFDLFWRLQGEDEAILPMTLQDEVWQAIIPGPFDEQTVEYRMELTGSNGFFTALPYDPEDWFSFHVGLDQEAPTIAIVQGPLNLVGFAGDLDLVVRAEDNLGIDQVSLEIAIDGNDWQEILGLEAIGDNLYSGLIEFEYPGVEQIQWRFTARDQSQSAFEASTDVVTTTLGQEQFVDDFATRELDNWTVEGVWVSQGLRNHSAPYALSTSDDGFYDIGSTGTATWNTVINLRHLEEAWLVLWECWFMDEGNDFAYIEVSADDGENWEILATRTGIQGWEDEWISLEAYVGTRDLQLRWRFEADNDNSGLHIGYYVDDVRLVHEGTDVEPRVPGVRPTKLALSHAWPNPFNPTARIQLTLADAQAVHVALYNVRGQEVALLSHQTLNAGVHDFQLQGEALASGLYFVRATTKHEMVSQKVLLLK